MVQELHQLLQLHKFLKQALQQHGTRMPASDVESIKTRIDQTFLEIVRHETDLPQVTMAQIQFLLRSLARVTADDDSVSPLVAACRRHVDRLESQMKTALTLGPLPPTNEHRYLDSLPDRVAIIDTDYRYRFTNVANARLHGVTPNAFVGRPNVELIGEANFAKINKPRFEACFAGHSVSYFTKHVVEPSMINSVRIDPIQDKNGKISALLILVRDVSHLPVPNALINQMPTPFTTQL